MTFEEEQKIKNEWFEEIRQQHIAHPDTTIVKVDEHELYVNKTLKWCSAKTQMDAIKFLCLSMKVYPLEEMAEKKSEKGVDNTSESI